MEYIHTELGYSVERFRDKGRDVNSEATAVLPLEKWSER
jgi:hypothetical protein